MRIQRVFLIRHAEMAWSLSGQHTSITDIARRTFMSADMKSGGNMTTPMELAIHK